MVFPMVSLDKFFNLASLQTRMIVVDEDDLEEYDSSKVNENRGDDIRIESSKLWWNDERLIVAEAGSNVWEAFDRGKQKNGKRIVE